MDGEALGQTILAVFVGVIVTMYPCVCPCQTQRRSQPSSSTLPHALVPLAADQGAKRSGEGRKWSKRDEGLVFQLPFSICSNLMCFSQLVNQYEHLSQEVYGIFFNIYMSIISSDKDTRPIWLVCFHILSILSVITGRLDWLNSCWKSQSISSGIRYCQWASQEITVRQMQSVFRPTAEIKLIQPHIRLSFLTTHDFRFNIFKQSS